MKKETNKEVNHDKIIIVLLMVVSTLLIVNLYISLNHINGYEAQRQSGDNRWKQVEAILNEYDARIRDIEGKIIRGE